MTDNLVIVDSAKVTEAAKKMADLPTFDLSDLSWGESEMLSISQAKLQAAQQANDATQIAASFVDLRRYLAKVTQSVPRSWLVKSAPGNIDWSDPASFGFVKYNRMANLQKALAEAIEEDSKN